MLSKLQDVRIHLKKLKFGHPGKVGECLFVYNTVNGRYSPCKEDPTVEQPKIVVSFDRKYHGSDRLFGRRDRKYLILK